MQFSDRPLSTYYEQAVGLVFCFSAKRATYDDLTEIASQSCRHLNILYTCMARRPVSKAIIKEYFCTACLLQLQTVWHMPFGWSGRKILECPTPYKL